MSVTVKRRWYSGKITIMSPNIDELSREFENWEAQGYEAVMRENGYAMYMPFWRGGFAFDMIKAKGQLEKRMEGDKR